MENQVDCIINSNATYQVLIIGIGGFCLGQSIAAEPLFQANNRRTVDSSFISDQGSGVSMVTSEVSIWLTTVKQSPARMTSRSCSLLNYYWYQNALHDSVYDKNNFRSLTDSRVTIGTSKGLMFKVQTCRTGFMTSMQNGMSALSWKAGGHPGRLKGLLFTKMAFS